MSAIIDTPVQTAVLPRATPESQGMASQAILDFVNAVEANIRHLHSFMLLRHGQVVAETWWAPYRADRPHVLFSLSKSFTSTAIGLAVSEGLLTVDDKVLDFFADAAPARPSAYLRAMRVRDLLSMTTGHAVDTLDRVFRQRNGDWARAFLAQPVTHQPGTFFVYNSGATYMLSAILTKLTGMRLLDYLTPRLLAPLGIEGATWEQCPKGIDTGGWGLSIKTEDIARFGQLYLQQGVWQGRQVVPAAWVDEATRIHADNSSNENIDWAQGYGYQFWRSRHNAYRGDGAFGQFCIVMPDQAAVLAITSGVQDMQAVLDQVWTHLLPAMQSGPQRVDATVQAELQRRLAAPALPTVAGAASSPTAAQVSGRTYTFGRNEPKLKSVQVTFTPDGGATLVQRDGHGTHTIAVGHGAWVEGMTAMGSPRKDERPVTASGAWTAPDTYTIGFCFPETPFCPTLALRFDGDTLTYTFTENVSFGPTEHPPLTAKAQPAARSQR
jgi:CubicO group peptidase (beta-lactamase class C family)